MSKIKKKNKEDYSINHTEMLLSRFKNLAINRFNWEGLPDGLTSRKMELMLIEHGQVAFFKDEETGVICCLPCTGVNTFDMYNEPLYYNVIGNQYNNTFERDKIVVVRNNGLSKADNDDLILFAERINEVEQTMDVNLFQQNTPYMVLCDENERLTFKNIVKQIREFKFVIFGRKNLKFTDNTTVLNTKAEYLLDKLQQHKTELMNELLTYLGINNNNSDKKERLIVDEVNANNDFILVNIDHMFDEREKSVNLINEMFGTNIKVEKREVKFNGLYNNTQRDSGNGDKDI